ncbi:hypothetical protein BHE74_00058114, partial [Ensete ventricosum]
RPRVGRYVLVRQLIGTRTARYRAVPSKSNVSDRFRSSAIDFGRRRSISVVGDRLKEKGGEEEGEEREKYVTRAALPWFSHAVCCPRVIPSPWATFAILTFTARYGRYIPVRHVAGTRTARYRAIPPKIDRRRSISGEKGKNKKRNIAFIRSHLIV